jgi:hypothetical protein
MDGFQLMRWPIAGGASDYRINSMAFSFQGMIF